MKVLWRYDGNVYEVLTETGEDWVIDYAGSACKIPKSGCVIVEEKEMKVVWQGDGEVYTVVGEEEAHWVVTNPNVVEEYLISKGQCAELAEGEEELVEELIANMKEESKKHNHYYKDVSELGYVDVYRVCELFGVDDTSGAIHHAVKKLLCSGVRGVKGKQQDVQEAVDTLNRWIEMQGE